MTALTERDPPRAPAPAQASLEVRSYGDRLFKLLLTLGAVSVPVLLGFLVLELWQGSRLAIAKFGLGFVTNSVWDPVTEEFGAFPLIFGTLVSSLVALVIAVPLSLGDATYPT